MPIANRTDYVHLSRAFKRVVLRTTDNSSIVETTNKFEDSNILLFMVCGFTNWNPKATERDHCKNFYL